MSVAENDEGTKGHGKPEESELSNGTAAGDLPALPASRRKFGLYKGLIEIGPEFFEPLPEEELKAWEGEA